MEGISNSSLVLRISACVVGAKGVVLGGVCSAVFALYITGLLPGIGNIPPPLLLIGGIAFTPNGILLILLQIKKFILNSRRTSNEATSSEVLPYSNAPMPRMIETERVGRTRARRFSSITEFSEKEEEIAEIPERKEEMMELEEVEFSEDFRMKELLKTWSENDYPNPLMPTVLEEQELDVIEVFERAEEIEGDAPYPIGNLQLGDLPNELLDYIFSFILVKEMTEIKLVCSRFNRLLNVSPSARKKLGEFFLENVEKSIGFVDKDRNKAVRLKMKVCGRMVLLHNTETNRERLTTYKKNIIKQCKEQGKYRQLCLCIRELVKMGFHVKAWREAAQLISSISEESPMSTSRAILFDLCFTLMDSIKKMAMEGKKYEALEAYNKLLGYRENKSLHPEITSLDISPEAIAVGDLEFARNFIQKHKNGVNFLHRVIEIFLVDRTDESWQEVIATARHSKLNLRKLDSLVFLARTTGETELLRYELLHFMTHIKKRSDRLPTYKLLIEAFFHLNEPEAINYIFNKGRRTILHLLKKGKKSKISRRNIRRFIAVSVQSGLIQETKGLIRKMGHRIRHRRDYESSLKIRNLNRVIYYAFDKAVMQMGKMEDLFTKLVPYKARWLDRNDSFTDKQYYKGKLMLQLFEQKYMPQLNQ